MPTDILRYNAINSATQSVIIQNAGQICASLYASLLQAAGRTSSTGITGYAGAGKSCHCQICRYPLLTGGTSVNICDTALSFAAGVCCQWTVPAGVTAVQFQLWAGGGGSSSGYCCSMSHFGASGAYAITTIKTTPGCTYTICAGSGGTYGQLCAGSCGQNGSPSYVTGYGLTGFCADGGLNSLAAIYNQVVCHNAICGNCTYTGYCMYNVPCASTTSGGYCICSDGSMCTASGCSSGACIGTVFLCNTYAGTNSSPFYNYLQGSCGVWGVPGMMGCGINFGSSCGAFNSAPLIGTGHSPGCCYCACMQTGMMYAYDSYSGCNWCNYHCNYANNACGCQGTSTLNSVMFGYYADPCHCFLCHPGAGGFASYYNGYNCYCNSMGGNGRAGMVRITYC